MDEVPCASIVPCRGDFGQMASKRAFGESNRERTHQIPRRTTVSGLPFALWRGAMASIGTRAVTDFDRQQMSQLAGWAARYLGTPRQSPFCADVVETATGRLVLRRLNAVAAEIDPSSHAEVRVLRATCKKLKKLSLSGHTLYTTCEPCPMCMSMALWSGIDRVVFGATIADAAKHCRQIYIPAKTVAKKSDMACTVVGPVGQADCVALFEDKRMQEMMKTWRHVTAKPAA